VSNLDILLIFLQKDSIYQNLFPVKHGFPGINKAFLPVPHFIAVFVLLNGPPRINLTLLQVALHFAVWAFYDLPARGYIALLCIKGMGGAGCFTAQESHDKQANYKLFFS
jgi:hypothetical protein